MTSKPEVNEIKNIAKLAVVTGAASEIGKVIAISLAKSGSDVAINSSVDSDQAQEVVAAVNAVGSKGFFANVMLA